MITSNQSNDIPMAGKTVIVTGANRGIGAVITREIARLGAKIIMACRSTDLAEVTRNQILAEIGYGKLEVRKLDLENQSSIKSFASAFLKDHSRLDVLINNAGLQVPERKLTAKGVELTFAVNVLGPHLLTELLLDARLKSAPSRIINVASDFADGLELSDLNFEHRKYTSVAAYKQSKQANRMLTREWARRLRKNRIWVNSMTPMFTPGTDLFRDQKIMAKIAIRLVGMFIGVTVDQAADTVVWLANDASVEGVTGGYFRKRQKVDCRFEDAESERLLWEKCASLLR